MGYQINYRSSFKKELRRLPPVMRRAVTKRILGLADNPRPNGVEKIRGAEHLYRIRQGDYRVIYGIHDDVLVIILLKVGHRSDVYRNY